MKRILIADDDFISLEVLKAMLSRYPVEILTAMTGAGALQQALEQQPALLILDYEMPDFTGAEICLKLRQNSMFATTPIVALTSHQSPNELEACRNAGMNQTLHKPVAPDAIEQLLRGHQIIT